MNKGMVVERPIIVRAFLKENNRPTCALDFTKGLFCQFFGTRNYGQDEVCLYHNTVVLFRGLDEFLIPHDKCPLWQDKK